MRGVYEKVKGSKDFYIRYTDNEGRRHREHVGRESAACEALVNRRREIREGRFITRHTESRITFEELFDQRMEAKDLKPGTVRDYRYQFGTKRFDALRKMPARSIRPEDIEKFLSSLRKEIKPRGGNKRASNFTIRNYRSLIGAVLAHGVARDHLSANPVLKTDSPKEPEGRVRFLSLDEEEAIRKQLREACPEREAEFDLLLYSGIRIGELWHLTWDRVHPDRGIIDVPDEGKTGWRSVPMNSVSRKACEILHRQSRGSSFVVPNAQTKRGRRYLALWLGEAAEKAGVLEVTPHTLRHTFASRLVMAGVNLRRVQEYLGHKSIEMTMKYAHLAPEQGTPDIERMVTAAAAPAAARVKPPVKVARPARIAKIA